jgi:hypothetical protein
MGILEGWFRRDGRGGNAGPDFVPVAEILLAWCKLAGKPCFTLN